MHCAHQAAARPLVSNVDNGDEANLPLFAGNYSKALPHDTLGHVDPVAYRTLLTASRTGLNKVPFKPGIPSVVSRTCEAFVDWGAPHLLALVCEVSTRALKAVWYHKWIVHRRLRPEEFGGRVHNQLTGRFAYPIHPDVLDSRVVARVLSDTERRCCPWPSRRARRRIHRTARDTQPSPGRARRSSRPGSTRIT
jgi:hypothetical protein